MYLSMRVCLCVCVCVCVCVHVCVCVCVCIHIHINTFVIYVCQLRHIHRERGGIVQHQIAMKVMPRISHF